MKKRLIFAYLLKIKSICFNAPGNVFNEIRQVLYIGDNLKNTKYHLGGNILISNRGIVEPRA